MKSRSKKSIFYWSPITKLLPHRNQEKCRRTLCTMAVMDNQLITTIQKLTRMWEYIYKEGIKNGDIQDERPWDTKDFDLCRYLEYFLHKLREEHIR